MKTSTEFSISSLSEERLVSLECLKKRILLTLAKNDGKALQSTIIAQCVGKKSRLIRALDDLAVSGQLVKSGIGKKGCPLAYCLAERPIACAEIEMHDVIVSIAI
jgi:DNA-binding IscR family transcriptional regulator